MLLVGVGLGHGQVLTQWLEGLQTYHVSRRSETPFLTDLSL